MPITIKYSQVKPLVQVMQKLGDVPAAGSAFKVARNLIALRPLEDAVTAVTSSVSGYREFSKKQAALLEKHAKRDERGQPIRELVDTPQGKMARYDIADPHTYALELDPLVKEHEADIQAEDVRLTTLPEAMEQEVEVSLVPIDPQWCEGILNAKEIVVLLDCKLVSL